MGIYLNAYSNETTTNDGVQFHDFAPVEKFKILLLDEKPSIQLTKGKMKVLKQIFGEDLDIDEFEYEGEELDTILSKFEEKAMITFLNNHEYLDYIQLFNFFKICKDNNYLVVAG